AAGEGSGRPLSAPHPAAGRPNAPRAQGACRRGERPREARSRGRGPRHAASPRRARAKPPRHPQAQSRVLHGRDRGARKAPVTASRTTQRQRKGGNMPRPTRSILVAALAAAALATPAAAQTKLKWAHVYEVNEPYHTEAVWAGQEIAKRTNGKYEIEVFPASQLGNENQINEALTLGTVDMIYTGVAFAGSIHKPLAITNAPFVLRDFDHWKAYRASKLFRDIASGYEKKTSHKVIAITYYGQRHVTANRAITKPDD